MILSQEASVNVVGSVGSGIQMIEAIRELDPDIVLLDMNRDDKDTVQALPMLRRKGTRVLMLTTESDEGMILDALKAGARGYLSENTTIQSLIKAIKSVSKGEIWVERKMISRMVDRDTNIGPGANQRQDAPKELLTSREREVLALLKEGKTNKEIAQTLYISEKTVKSHMNSIFRKFNVNGRLQAIVHAIKNGLL
jgi:two-component system response regulator DegU